MDDSLFEILRLLHKLRQYRMSLSVLVMKYDKIYELQNKCELSL